MLIRNLLEGTIKVPENFMNQTKAVVSSHVFSQILTFLESDEGDEYFDNIGYIKKFIREKKAVYGDFAVGNVSLDHVSHGTAVLRRADIEPKYLKRAPKFKQQTVDIHVKNSDGLSWGLYYPKAVGYAPAVIVNSPSIEGIKRVATSPEMLPAMFNKLDSVIEHELMHSMQDLILKVMTNAGEGSVNTDTGEIVDMDKYMSDPDEFSPMVISHAHEFKGVIAQAKATGYHMSKEAVRSLFRRFVDPTAPKPEGADIPTADFFDVLYRKKPSEWKRAVKYLHDKLYGTL